MTHGLARRTHGEAYVHHATTKGDGDGAKEGIWMLSGKEERARDNHSDVITA